MRNHPVNWAEGMFLRPQQFQAADRHSQEVIHTSEQWDHHFGYGIRSITISPEAIANSQFEVQSLQARMRDGSLISVGPELNRVDLKPAFARHDTVRILLAVPKRTSSGANVGDSTSENPLRYSVEEVSLPDECSGGNDQEIELKKLNVRLIDDTQDLPGYELLPIAQVRRSGNDAIPQLDASYIPPTIAIDGWTELQRDYVRAIFDMIGTKIELVSAEVKRRGLLAHEPRDFERVLILRILNEAYAVLRNLAFVPGVHPFTAFTELCRIVGMLAILSPDRRAKEILVYDHDNLARVFTWARREIKSLIKIVQESRIEIRYFEGECPDGLVTSSRGGTSTSGSYLKPRMRVSVEPDWLGTDWSLYVGVRADRVPKKVVRELLEPGFLDWKMGCSRDVDYYFDRKIEGLNLLPTDDVPPELDSSREWLYFEVTRGNDAWVAVVETGTLAMRFNENLIDDPAALDRERKLIVKTRQETVELEIALFAVPAGNAS